jgi:hypothetical protein
MKDEGGRMKDEVKASCLYFLLPTSSFLLHPSYFILDLCVGAKTGKLPVSVFIRFSDLFSIEEL